MTEREMIASVRNNICEQNAAFWTDYEIGENLQQALDSINLIFNMPYQKLTDEYNIDVEGYPAKSFPVINYATFLTLLKDNEQADRAFLYIIPALMPDLILKDKLKETIEALKECFVAIRELRGAMASPIPKCLHPYIKAFVTSTDPLSMSVTTCSHDNEGHPCLKCPDCGGYVTWEERERMRNEG